MNRETLIEEIETKYGNVSDFKSEIEALDQFENFKRSSSHNLKSNRNRMTIGFIFTLCLTVVLGVLSIVMSHITTNDIMDVYEGSLSVRYYAFKINISAHKSYLAMRNLALCEEHETAKIMYYIDQAKQNAAIVSEDFYQLRALSNDDGPLADKFEELHLLLDEWNAMREKDIQLAINGNMADFRRNVMNAFSSVVTPINTCISEIADESTIIAANKYNEILNRSSVFDKYLISLTVLIVLASLSVMIYVQRYTLRTMKLVNEAQQEQDKILDELMVMDETLRKNFLHLEREAEIILEMQERYANSLEAANDAIWELDIETNEFFASAKWSDITGLAPMKRFNMEELLNHIDEKDRKKFKSIFKNKSGYFDIQIRGKSKGESIRWLNIRGKWLDNHRLTGSILDITEKKMSEQYIEYMAFHDTTTNLPNRTQFSKSLSEALDRAVASESTGCVLFIDIDNFKVINDGYGHDFGDKLLLQIAYKLEQKVSKDGMLARFGGDEFMVMVENISGIEDARRYLQAVMDVFSKPFMLDDLVFHLTSSIGVTLFPKNGRDVTQILKNADTAMHESKNAGRNTFAFYNDGMSAKLSRKSAISDVLHSAIKNDSVYMVYQPQVRCSDGKVVGFEALMRLRDQGLGFISPAEFIPVAEDTMLIVPLGYWAIRNVIETDLSLQKQGIVLESVSVNVSELQLRERDFIDQVKSIIDEYNYNASRLHFEITESILLSNVEEEIAILNKLKGIGVKIELDDFGTGYSSLNYVRMLPLDAIKIDKCFTDEIGISKEKEGLIDVIVLLAEMSNAKIVVEGVETETQVEFFKDINGVIIQGYYYSKPLELIDFRDKYEELNAAASTKE